MVFLCSGAASCGGRDAGRDVVSAGQTPGGAGLPTGTLQIKSSEGDAVLDVEIADTPQARSRGLMGRRYLAPDAGMVFLFDEPTTSSFWMKNTLIPLSIGFWDRSRRIVSILDMEPCRRTPCRLYSPGSSYIGAVEVNRGFFEANGIDVGDRIELER